MSLQLVSDIQRVAGLLAMVLQAEGGSADVFALAILGEGGSFDIAGLQARLAVPPSTLSSILNRLEKKGLVRRQTSTRDRRKFDLVLTREGRIRADTAKSFIEGLEDRMTGALSYGQVIAFTEVVEVLERVLSNIKLKPAVEAVAVGSTS